MENMGPIIKEEILSDGSKVFDVVVFPRNGVGTDVIFHCVNYDSAVTFLESIEENVIDVTG